LNDAIGTHAPVALAGSGGQIDGVSVDAELNERLSPATKTFPLIPETEANSTTDPIVPVHLQLPRDGFQTTMISADSSIYNSGIADRAAPFDGHICNPAHPPRRPL
jgi:hypothetical protein